jgi:hypothetical protein
LTLIAAGIRFIKNQRQSLVRQHQVMAAEYRVVKCLSINKQGGITEYTQFVTVIVHLCTLRSKASGFLSGREPEAQPEALTSKGYLNHENNDH